MFEISKINFIPFFDINYKGQIGWINCVISLDGRELIQINSLCTFANRLDNPEKIHLTFPGKKSGKGIYNYYYQLLDPELIKKITKMAEAEIGRQGFLTTFNDELNEQDGEQNKQSNSLV